MRRAAKKDSNQNEIARELQQVGATVYDTSKIGAGYPDLTVGFRGATFLLEVKAKNGTLTKDESLFFQTWNGHAVVVRSADEALKAIGAI